MRHLMRKIFQVSSVDDYIRILSDEDYLYGNVISVKETRQLIGPHVGFLVLG